MSLEFVSTMSLEFSVNYVLDWFNTGLSNIGVYSSLAGEFLLLGWNVYSVSLTQSKLSIAKPKSEVSWTISLVFKLMSNMA